MKTNDLKIGDKLYVNKTPKLFNRKGELDEGDLYCTITSIGENLIFIEKYNEVIGFYTRSGLDDLLEHEFLIVKNN